MSYMGRAGERSSEEKRELEVRGRDVGRRRAFVIHGGARLHSRWRLALLAALRRQQRARVPPRAAVLNTHVAHPHPHL